MNHNDPLPIAQMVMYALPFNPLVAKEGHLASQPKKEHYTLHLRTPQGQLVSVTTTTRQEPHEEARVCYTLTDGEEVVQRLSYSTRRQGVPMRGQHDLAELILLAPPLPLTQGQFSPEQQFYYLGEMRGKVKDASRLMTIQSVDEHSSECEGYIYTTHGWMIPLSERNLCIPV